MEIGIWGDSITYGQGDSEALGWVGRWRKKLGENARVYNFGIGGDTSSDVLKRFTVEADSIMPNMIVFAIGINDSKLSPDKAENKVSLELFKDNVGELLELARKYTDKIYVVGATKADAEVTRPSGAYLDNSVIQEYNAVLKEVAETEKIGFIPVFDVVDVKKDLVDGLHPNAQGYEKMFQLIQSEIKL